MTEKKPPKPLPTPDEHALSAGGPPIPEDEINLLELAYVLIKYKTVIILFSVMGLFAGYFAAKAKGPTYKATASIMAKEDKQSPGLGALGALSSFAAMPLNLAGNPGLEKLEINLDSRQFNSELIEKYGLTDDIYKFGLPKVYRKHYDTIGGKWIISEEFPEVPEPIKIAAFFAKKFFSKEIDAKKGIFTLSTKSSDSAFTCKVIEGTLEHLNYYIQTNVQKDAKDNVDFLEQQLITIADPLLREKLQAMIASEIEKAMLVSREAFKIIDKPFCTKTHRETKLYPIAAASGMFMISSAAAIFLYYIFGGGNTDSASRQWVTRIRRELFRIL